MKKLAEHLGSIIAVLAAVALLTSVVAFASPGLTDFFSEITSQTIAKADNMLDGINTPSANDGSGGSGGSGGAETGDTDVTSFTFVCGQTECYEIASFEGISWYRFTDIAPSAEKLEGGLVTMTHSDGSLLGNAILTSSDGTMAILSEDITVVGGIAIIVEKDNAEFEGCVFPKKGVYVDEMYVNLDPTDAEDYELLFGLEITVDWSNSALIHSNTIPEGGTYYVGATGTTVGDYSGATATYTSGNSFPDTVSDGDVYVYGDYEYRYNRVHLVDTWYETSNDTVRLICGDLPVSWSVRVLDDSKTSYGEIISAINGNTVSNLVATFYNCTSLKSAPALPCFTEYALSTFQGCTSLTDVSDLAIPNTVVHMGSAFKDCTSLTNVGGLVIPSSVQSLHNAFSGCTALTTAPIIPSSVTLMDGIFFGCTSLKTYVGSTDADGDFSGYEIPSNVTNMYQSFFECTSLTTAPVLPGNVEDMRETFYGCTNLTGAITINASPSYYSNCLYGTQITEILGECTIKDQLLATIS